MALRQIMIDDMELTEGAETRTFSLDSVSYEIDLNDKNYQKLSQALRPFIDSGRRQAATKAKSRKTSDTKADMEAGVRHKVRLSKEQNEAIREWARKRGHKVSGRGRIPTDIINEFNEDHQPAPSS